MQPTEFAALRARSQEPDEELAATLGVGAERLRRWSSGAERIPRYHRQLLEFIVAAEERRRALSASGLPLCARYAEMAEYDVSDDPDEARSQLARETEHQASCPECQARERFLAARFGPMPPFPVPRWLSPFMIIQGLPAPLRPAAYGAAALAAIVLFRALFMIPAMIARPALALQLPVAVVAAAAAGASGGFAFTLVRPTFKRLGRIGDHLTGVVCAGAYMTSLTLVAPLAFGEPLVEGRAGWYAVGIASLFFGAVIGHSWFKPEPKPDRA